MIPSPWVAVVLGLAAFRLTRLTGWDDFPPVAWVRAKALGEQAALTGDFNQRHGLTTATPEPVITYRRPILAHGLSCAYCAGWWWCVVVYGAWRLWPSQTVVAAFVLAMSAFVGTWARILDP